MPNRPILTITLNPALDVTTSLDRLRPMQKLRCSSPRYDAGGGGVNVSRALKELGADSRAFVGLGGATGQHLSQILVAAGVEAEIWKMRGETRFSLTVMEQARGQQYRFVLPGPEQAPGDAKRLLAKLALTIGKARPFVIASGSLPPGLPDDFYGQMAVLTRRLGAKLILDCSGAALAAAATQRPYLIRINHHEAQALAGGSDPYAAAETVARGLAESHAAEIVIVTIGEAGAIFATPKRAFRIRPPRVEVVSAVGAGDSFVAALTLCFAKGWALDDAGRYAVAAAAAAVTTEATQLCERPTVEKLFAQMSKDTERLA